MIAPEPVYPRSSVQTPCVENVLSSLRALNLEYPGITYLEARALQAVLRRRGFHADLAMVESAAGWLLLDELEITA